MRRQSIVSLVVVFAATGCATRLVVTKVEPSKPETHVGIPHPLLYSRYDVKLRWQVVKCGADIGVKVGAEFKGPVAVPDADNLFVIDPASLLSPLKTSDLLVEYLPSGAPASLNAKVEDRGAQVLVGVASIGAGLVKFGAVPTPGAPAVPAAEAAETCSDDVVKALEMLPEKNQVVEAATLLVDARTTELKAVTDKLATMGNNVDEATKQALSKAIDALGLAKTQLGGAAKAQAKTLEAITYEQAVLWPLKGSDTTGVYELPVFVFQRWTTEITKAKDRTKATIHLSLRGRDSTGGSSQTEMPVRPELGIPIRQGAEGEVSACAGQSCASGGEPVGKRVDHILQLGGIYYLPCISRPFSSVSCSYKLDDNGRLKSMGSVFTNAPAETLTTAFNDVVKQATEARQAKREAKTKQIEAETAYLKAKVEREAADAAVAKEDLLKADKDATAALKAQADRLDAQRALIEAEQALEDAQIKATKNP